MTFERFAESSRRSFRQAAKTLRYWKKNEATNERGELVIKQLCARSKKRLHCRQYPKVVTNTIYGA
jgi:hypothetical protein